MNTISTHKHMNKIYYSSQSSIGKQTLAYLKSSFKDLLAIDVTKTNVTGTQWKALAEALHINVEDLIYKKHPVYLKDYESKTNLDEHGWIKILNNNPEVLNYPVVILGHDYYQIKNPSAIEKALESNYTKFDPRSQN
ncbi:hypothetical protein [uncultured Psychroserpens sp.]|uniref:arsenate reductase family protein n=1 Tax=uncultured Psychroserpens sp. TaxID=255436 RepID=UPI00263A0200|nr:hypothetical protein [uncultured Psychroserpens sp.]